MSEKKYYADGSALMMPVAAVSGSRAQLGAGKGEQQWRQLLKDVAYSDIGKWRFKENILQQECFRVLNLRSARPERPEISSSKPPP